MKGEVWKSGNGTSFRMQETSEDEIKSTEKTSTLSTNADETKDEQKITFDWDNLENQARIMRERKDNLENLLPELKRVLKQRNGDESDDGNSTTKNADEGTNTSCTTAKNGSSSTTSTRSGSKKANNAKNKQKTPQDKDLAEGEKQLEQAIADAARFAQFIGMAEKQSLFAEIKSKVPKQE